MDNHNLSSLEEHKEYDLVTIISLQRTWDEFRSEVSHLCISASVSIYMAPEFPSWILIITVYSCSIHSLSFISQKSSFFFKYPINHKQPASYLGRMCSLLKMNVMVQFVLNTNGIKLAVSQCSDFYFCISPCFCKRYLLRTQLRFLLPFISCIQHLKFIFCI